MEPETKTDFSKYEKYPLWSERDFQALCCGLSPDGSRESTSELNEAAELIRLAVLAKDIPVQEPVDATAGDRLYGHARFFKPAAVIPWASAMFPGKFPFRVKEKTLTPRERDTLLTIIAALLENSGIKHNERGAARKIAEMTDGIGVPVDEETILDKLKQIPDATENRVR